MTPRKTIRDIQLPSKKKTTTPTSRKKKSSSQSKSSGTGGYTSTYSDIGKRKSSGWGWVVGILALLVGGLIVWTVFAQAQVTITPKTAHVAIGSEVTLVGHRDAGAGELPYEIIQLDDTLTQSLQASETEFVEERASGTIIIYNEEKTAQRFVEETRFETPDGLIYKLAKGNPVTVPAAQGDTPGTVEVTVYADEPGEQYNGEPTDFVIPGWREIKSSKFTTQYARSKTPMTGGFSGERPQVSDEDVSAARTRLQASLERRLHKEIIANVPDDYVVFDGAIDITYTNDAPIQASEGDSVEVAETATATAVIFDRYELSKVLARELVDTYQNEDIRVSNFDTLVLTTNQNIQDFRADSLPVEFSFDLTGEPEFIWQIDTKDIADALSEKQKKEFSSIVNQFSGVEHAALELKPLWAPKIPEAKRIHVVVKENEKQSKKVGE